MPSPQFFELHSSLPREGPGDDATTRSVLLSLDLPQAPKVLDVGCGPGAQSLVLARESGGTVTAVDVHQPFLDELERRAANAGLDGRNWRRLLRRGGFLVASEATWLDPEPDCDVARRHGDAVGYVFYVMRRSD